MLKKKTLEIEHDNEKSQAFEDVFPVIKMVIFQCHVSFFFFWGGGNVFLLAVGRWWDATAIFEGQLGWAAR